MPELPVLPAATVRPSGRPPVPAFLGRIDRHYAGLAPAAVGVRVALLIFAVTVLDVITGPELAFSIFYLVPVGLAAWYMRWRAALTAVVAVTAAWLLADILAQAEYTQPIVRYWNALVRGSTFLTVTYVLAVLRATLSTEQRLARTDAITGLPNWRAFEEAATRELARARRTKTPITVAYLDLDDFKQVNDTRGHEAGNELLAAVGNALRSAVRVSDVVARVGGDEFVVLLPDCSLAGARVALEHARQEVCRALGGWGVGCSMGSVSHVAAVPETLEELIRSADALLYRVKSSGKNTVGYQEL